MAIIRFRNLCYQHRRDRDRLRQRRQHAVRCRHQGPADFPQSGQAVRESGLHGAYLRREPQQVRDAGERVQGERGHLSRRMLEHYSHVRLDAKRKALDELDIWRESLADQRASAIVQ